jgi:hypothetical protein
MLSSGLSGFWILTIKPEMTYGVVVSVKIVETQRRTILLQTRVHALVVSSYGTPELSA